MDPLTTLIDRWHNLTDEALAHPNSADDQIAADNARRELDLRLVTLESFLTGLYHACTPGAHRALLYVAGSEDDKAADKAPE